MNIQADLFNTHIYYNVESKQIKSDPGWDNGDAYPEFLEEILILEWCPIPLRKTYKATFNKTSCDYSICVPVLVQGFHSQVYNWGDLKLLVSQRLINTAAIAYPHSSQKSITTEISTNLLSREDGDSNQEQSTLLPPVLPVSLSQSKVKEQQPQTIETASLHYSESSINTNQNISALKTFQDYSIVPINQEAIADISDLSFNNYPQAGMMRNGKLYQAGTLQAPLTENDCCWLPAPTAMSTKSSRPPGLSKLENILKKNKLISKGEVLNPVILCQWFGIPITWLDPSESLTAIQILEDNERQQEIFSLLTSQRLPSKESSISNLAPDKSCPQCGAWLNPHKNSCQVCGWTPENFLEDPSKTKKRSPNKKRRNKKGSLYKYLENKKLKDGGVVSYPRITSDFRDPENPHHWRWGYHWDEKIDKVWKGRSIGSIPPGVIGYIKDMRSRNVQIEEIISFIKKAKRKK